jgi:Fe-S cluster assembly protein SufD
MSERGREVGLLRVLDAAPSGGPAWLDPLRRAGVEALRAKGLPGKHDEAWRFTSVRELAEPAYEVASGVEAEARLRELVEARFGEDGAHRVAVIDGRPSVPSALPEGLEVSSLADALAGRSELVEAHLGEHAGTEFFAGLNAAMFRDGVVVRLARGRALERPLHLVHLSAASEKDVVVHPRLVIVVEAGAELCLVESFLGRTGAERRASAPGPTREGAGRHLTNLVSEIVLEPGARLEHVIVHDGVDRHVARVAVQQAGGSAYRSRVFTFGGALVRLDVEATLAGEGASAELDGVYHVAGEDHVDHQLRVVHRAPRCTSRQVYRGVLDGAGEAVFDGTTVVERGAQRTEAHQENRNLLLSDSATVNTKPHLRIDADDVVCSHGATVGSIDPEQLFYLRARGVPEALARAMLTFAFLRALVEGVTHAPTRERLIGALLERLPEGEQIVGTV